MSGVGILILLAIAGATWGLYYGYTSYKNAKQQTEDVISRQLKGEVPDSKDDDVCNCKWL